MTNDMQVRKNEENSLNLVELGQSSKSKKNPFTMKTSRTHTSTPSKFLGRFLHFKASFVNVGKAMLPYLANKGRYDFWVRNHDGNVQLLQERKSAHPIYIDNITCISIDKLNSVVKDTWNSWYGDWWYRHISKNAYGPATSRTSLIFGPGLD